MHALSTRCLFKYITVAAFRIYLSVVKMPLKGEVGGHAIKSHGNYFVDHAKSWKNHGNVFLNSCGNPVKSKGAVAITQCLLSNVHCDSLSTICFKTPITTAADDKFCDIFS